MALLREVSRQDVTADSLTAIIICLKVWNNDKYDDGSLAMLLRQCKEMEHLVMTKRISF